MSGVAVFAESELRGAWLTKGNSWIDTAKNVIQDHENRYHSEVSELAIEIPQIYTQSKLKGDPNDLLKLTLVIGAVCGMLSPSVKISLYKPREWKGQTPKDVMIRRIQNKITEYERERVELPSAKSYQHNVWDAVGIGLFHVRKSRKDIFS